MNLRNYALCGAAEIILKVKELTSENRTSVATVGLLEINPGKNNIMPGKIRLIPDIRDKDDVVLNEITEGILNSFTPICKNRGLTYAIKQVPYTKPVFLSKRIARVIENLLKIKVLIH
ncbi:MAG: hypothetical protein RBS85_01220 [Methanofastidiosum sp.]|jgi:acetylornithine deacetylase/succinyl-diaminopimelate desuccinylase-like protein|nr:hypothetical protein [Methanofastidiosum sp.]